MNFFKYLAINSFVGVLLFVSMWTMSGMSQGAEVERPMPAGSPTAVLAKCVPTVEGQFPTGVVLQKIGGGTRLATNPVVVDKALHVALDGEKWNGVRVLNFCK